MWAILKHTKGTWHDEDTLVVNYKTRKTMKYKYKASADFVCSELNKAHGDRIKFTVVRLD